MNNSALAAILLMVFSIPASAVAADKYRCSEGNLERRVEIIYEPGRAVPCVVQYFKDTEAPGETQVLWRAQNESGYCESKAAAFIEQLDSQGWNCSDATAVVDEIDADRDEAVVDEPAEADDTDALAPAQDNN
jgi:hypothetical protein